MKRHVIKKLVAVSCTAVMLAGVVAGCGNTNTAETTTETATAEATTEAATEATTAEAAAETTETTESVTESGEVILEAVDGYCTYEDPNGWNVQFADGDFSVMTQSSDEAEQVFFVYQGESAGTNMITASYITGKNAKDYINELAASWGELATTGDFAFPSDNSIKGFRVDLAPGEGNDGSGLYQSAVARDYKDGVLVFEVTEHMCGDDAIDIPVSDAHSMIIDSLTFTE